MKKILLLLIAVTMLSVGHSQELKQNNDATWQKTEQSAKTPVITETSLPTSWVYEHDCCPAMNTRANAIVTQYGQGNVTFLTLLCSLKVQKCDPCLDEFYWKIRYTISAAIKDEASIKTEVPADTRLE